MRPTGTESGSLAVAMAMAVVVALVAAGCARPDDGVSRARPAFLAVEPGGRWVDMGHPLSSPLFTPGPDTTPVPADYDGDGVVDNAAVTPTGEWITQSARGTLHLAPPPQVAPYLPTYAISAYLMVPVPADYDGDHRAEPAWYRDTDGMWFIDGGAPIQFGAPPTAPPHTNGHPANDTFDQDYPAPADYDGDGRADLATYNPRTRVWKVRSSRDGTVSAVTVPGDRTTITFPAPGDYDGVHHAQRASYGDAGWWIEGHDEPIAFGARGRTSGAALDAPYPAAADYDGDGRFDLSYVSDTGDWRTRSSADPLDTTSFRVGNSFTGPATMPAAVGPARLLFARFTLLAKNCLPVPTYRNTSDC